MIASTSWPESASKKPIKKTKRKVIIINIIDQNIYLRSEG